MKIDSHFHENDKYRSTIFEHCIIVGARCIVPRANKDNKTGRAQFIVPLQNWEYGFTLSEMTG